MKVEHHFSELLKTIPNIGADQKFIFRMEHFPNFSQLDVSNFYVQTCSKVISNFYYMKTEVGTR